MRFMVIIPTSIDHAETAAMSQLTNSSAIVQVKPNIVLVFLKTLQGSHDRMDANFIPIVYVIPSLAPTHKPTGIQIRLYGTVVRYRVHPRPKTTTKELIPTTTDSPTHLLQYPAIMPPRTRPKVAALNINVTWRISSSLVELVAMRTKCGIIDIM